MSKKKRDVSSQTMLAHTGRNSKAYHGAVNPPVYHASTIIYENYAAISGKQPPDYTYGRRGTPTTRALETAITELENAHDTVLAPSGLSAGILSLMAFLQNGDHLLIGDNIYDPIKTFCQIVLPRMGMELTIFDPRDISALQNHIRPNSKVIFFESPGSLSFEMTDIDALVALAKKHKITTIMDNTWATPLFLKPLDKGVDISVQAATKYIGGHADTLLGYVSANKQSFALIKKMHGLLGLCAGPDDVRMGLRGLRTLDVRLKQHMQNGLEIADWLAQQPEVKKIIHPARPDHPDHALWQRDFTGCTGLFGMVLHPCAEKAFAHMLDGLEIFAMGYSWGGFESLIVPYPSLPRNVVPWKEEGRLCRLHIGLENVDDLKKDLRDGLNRLKQG